MFSDRSHSLMDRMPVCGIGDSGSIPGESTAVKQNTDTFVSVFCFSKQTSLLACCCAGRRHVFISFLEMKKAEAGSRTLSRLGAKRTNILSDS